MKAIALLAPIALLSLAVLLAAQETPAPNGDDEAAARAVAQQAGPERHDASALEQEFQRTMSGATLVGHFTLGGQAPGAPLKEERYTIHRVTKLGGDWWLFQTAIRYGGKDEVTVPVPLQVKWAGDTPVITLTGVPIPRLGTFTSRVLVYKGEYAGTWSGGDHGGHLFGRVIPAGAETAAEPAEAR